MPGTGESGEVGEAKAAETAKAGEARNTAETAQAGEVRDAVEAGETAEAVRAGQFIFAGIPGPTLDRSTVALLARCRPGGIVLFRRNIEDFEQLLDLVAGLRRCLPEVLIAVDAEGGRVDRLHDLLGPSPAGDLLARRAPSVAEHAGVTMGTTLRVLGFDLDFAPVVDLDRGAARNALDSRYLGAVPHAVAERAAAFLRGLAAAGIGGCLKHFPGLGAARADTHFHPATVALGGDELAADLAPFRALQEAAGAVMVAHAIYPALDLEGRPASLSPPVIEGLLRGGESAAAGVPAGLAFDGLCFSDDLEMKALAAWGDLPTRAEASFAAGCDVVLACATLEAVPEIAARLAAPHHAIRRAAAARRLAAYRGHLAMLRAGAAPQVKNLAELRAARGALMTDLSAWSTL